jgi:hypothetical protein
MMALESGMPTKQKGVLATNEIRGGRYGMASDKTKLEGTGRNDHNRSNMHCGLEEPQELLRSE